jgi:hypothetical protein
MPPAFALSQDQTLRFISDLGVSQRSKTNKIPSLISGTPNPIARVQIKPHKRICNA